jgi:hypothetical protein
MGGLQTLAQIRKADIRQKSPVANSTGFFGQPPPQRLSDWLGDGAGLGLSGEMVLQIMSRWSGPVGGGDPAPLAVCLLTAIIMAAHPLSL